MVQDTAQPHQQWPHSPRLPPNQRPPTRMSSLPPTLHSLSQLPFPPFFWHCVPPLRANACTSHHAYIDDILIKSEDVAYIQNSLNYFDGPARDCGLDMNLQRTKSTPMAQPPKKSF